jgi:diguanylate cyclase (GGDEF)-like protein
LSSRGVALIVADIDRFKQINDRHGHGAGDEVLREVAYKLAKALPAFAPLYRFGGEEFVTLLPDTELQAAVDIAERMRASLAGETTAGYPVTASFGVAAGVPGQPFELDAVFAQADRALYEAKRSGRNRVRASSGGAVAALRPARGRDRRAGIERTPGPDAYGAVAGPASAAPTAGDGSSWLANPLERQHLLDMTRRWLHAKPFPYLVAFAAIIFLGPWFGWWPILPVVLGSVVYRGVEERLEGMRRPELAYLMAWLLNQTGNALAYVVSHTPAHSPHPYSSAFALPLLILMIVPASSVLPARGVVICTVYTALLMLAVALSLDTTLLTQRPTEVAFSFALLVSVATVGCAVGRSAVHHRGVALVDRLTGLLNRRALELRTVELAQQARATRQPVAVLIGDLDRFKTVNDHHGHAA